MKSKIEAKERVVARGFSHYGNSQLWLPICILHAAMAFCLCYPPRLLFSEDLIVPMIRSVIWELGVGQQPQPGGQEKPLTYAKEVIEERVVVCPCCQHLKRVSKQGVQLTSQRLPSCCRLLGSGARVGKITEFGRGLCMLVLHMVRNGAIAQCIFHGLCSRMVLNSAGSRLGI